MNKRMLLALTVLVSLAVGSAIAATKLPYDSSRPAVAIHNATGMAPTKGKSGCVSQAITKGTFGNQTTLTGFMQYEGEVVTDAGAAEPVKWELDGTQVAVGPSFKLVNEGGATYARGIQRVYSGVSRTLTNCGRRR